MMFHKIVSFRETASAFAIGFLCYCQCLRAANPILPESFYADPEPHVWNDGKIYIYGSRDENRNYYCSDRYHFIYSADLIHWSDPGISFSVRDLPPDSGTQLYACDCAFKDRLYYLYISTDNGTLAVATSSSPVGPFGPAKRVGGLAKRPGIDPAVFLDDDGVAYLYWGQGDNVRAARLKPNLSEVDSNTIVQPLKRAEHHFHEGSSMTKRNGIYYYVYADESRKNKPTCIGYATGPTPLGPFTYRGVIIDNIGSDPGVWNNHGRIVEFKGNWYVFYHRSTQDGKCPRQISAEPIRFDDQGMIQEVKMTSSGIADPLDLTRRTPASVAAELSGNVRIDHVGTNWALTKIKTGDAAVYRGVTFSCAPKIFAARISMRQTNAVIEARMDNPASRPIATLAFGSTGACNSDWNEFSCPLQAYVPLGGIHTLLLSFQTGDPISLESFYFR